MSDELKWLAFIALAYLIGAIPFGLIIARSKGVDLRAHGSGNIGATNVLRTLGKKAGILCFTLDALKGALPVALSGAVMGVMGRGELAPIDALWWLAVAMATVLGHMFTIFARLRGGKGVATAFGALCAMWPVVTPATVAALIAWYITLRLTRYVSVASCVAALVLPACVLAFRASGLMTNNQTTPGDRIASAWPFLAVTSALAALVIYKHRANLARVRAGTEHRVGNRAHKRADADPKT